MGTLDPLEELNDARGAGKERKWRQRNAHWGFLAVPLSMPAKGLLLWELLCKASLSKCLPC